MSDLLWAHTPNTPLGAPHLLTDHALSVAALSKRFGTKLGHSDLCWLLGLAHDSGKANPEFQNYLRAAHQDQQAKSVPHSLPGAVAVLQQLNHFMMPILGHHGGLCDASDVKDRIEQARGVEVTAAKEFLERLGGAGILPIPELKSLQKELLIRMCLSALVDADRLDTAAFTAPATQMLRVHQSTLADIEARLTQNLDTKVSRADSVGAVRREVLENCRNAAQLAPGFFRLTVPTGGGKTLSSMSFALRHALAHGLERVIVAIPFTSIIEQTADVYRRELGDPKAVLEHHSAREGEPDGDEGQIDSEVRHRLLSENWDAPVVVTTTVQLFESLFSHHPRQVRKLHNIARSVLILDEVQSLPTEFLKPIVGMLRQLVESYGVSVVLCSATLPDFALMNMGGELEWPEQREIVPSYLSHFESLRRVEYRVERDELSIDDLARRLSAEPSALCILNSRPDAVQVAQAVGGDTLHLSTYMCPAHRRRVLEQARKRLDAGGVRLVSTQVVEAGVDLDFPVVFRASAPLASIIQAAGRCNREGLLEEGTCHVFKLAGGRSPKQGGYKRGTEVFECLSQDYPDSWHQPDVIRQYFEQLWFGLDLDKQGIEHLRERLAFRTTSERFRMIEPSESVLVMNYDADAIAELLAEYHEHSGLDWYRRARQYLVSIRSFDRARFAPDLKEHASGLTLFGGNYHPIFGVGVGTEPTPEDLIIS